MPAPQWLIEPILPTKGLVGLYGPPGAGKSFVAIDLALSVGSGHSWQGHPVDKGLVLYISAEGGSGIGKRVAAWLQVHKVEPQQTKMAWLLEPISVHSESKQLTRLKERIQYEVNEQPTLVIVDTLARCFDGDENQQEDMGRFIQGVDSLREEFDATVIVVHHTRLGGDRERGNTSFRGAADTMINLCREDDGRITLECNKQKDAEEFTPISFALEKVDGTNSCVIQPVMGVKTRAVSDKTVRILNVLREVGPCSWDDWCSSSGFARSRFHAYYSELVKKGLIIKENGLWRAI